ncbi:MAG: alanine--tRNA ligase-related protein, partial [Undibacterium sp.]
VNDELGFPRDTESAERWQSLFESVGIDAAIGEDSEKNGIQPGERIFYYSEKKNWWSRAGVPANMPVGEPGGPDTEMFWDFDPTNEKGMHESSVWKDEPCHVNCDCGRFMEIGNNVFMEYKKTENGFEKLAQQNVDFGGGLERMAAALANDPDVFKLDLFTGARTMLETLSGKAYGESIETTHAFRVILDHIRAAVFLIGDGVLPSNKDQGYFVRRLIRRAVRYGKKLGIETEFVSSVAVTFTTPYQVQYPVLNEKKVSIIGALAEEEKKFRATLEKGLQEVEKRLASGALTGKDAFELFSTYGFPLEMTEEMAVEHGASVNRDEFQSEFKQHQDLSRTASAGKFKGGLADHSAKVTALHTSTHLMLAGLRKELGPEVHQAGSNITEERTRFDFTYPEKVSREVLDRVEAYVNTAIAASATVGTTVMEKAAAKANGVEGSFWEKYPEKVTVYQVSGPDGTIYSQELCGGPHVATTADIAAFGRFTIVKEEASSAGVRRVKAVLE